MSQRAVVRNPPVFHALLLLLSQQQIMRRRTTICSRYSICSQPVSFSLFSVLPAPTTTTQLFKSGWLFYLQKSLFIFFWLRLLGLSCRWFDSLSSLISRHCTFPHFNSCVSSQSLTPSLAIFLPIYLRTCCFLQLDCTYWLKWSLLDLYMCCLLPFYISALRNVGISIDRIYSMYPNSFIDMTHFILVLFIWLTPPHAYLSI